jgi:ABC-2 type transport system permease protein
MLRDIYVLTGREMRRWWRSKMLLMLSFVMPLVWLGLFGQAFRLEALGGGSIGGDFLGGAGSYFSFMCVGMICMLVLVNSMQSGMSLIWDRRLGFLSKLQAAPINREVIPFSRIVSGMIKSIIIGMLAFGFALLFEYVPGFEGLILGNGFGPAELLIMMGVLVILSVGFGSLFTTIAIRIENHETLMAVINLMNLPILFTSAALFPPDLMPDWMSSIAGYNPLTWAADAVRQLVFDDAVAIYPLATDVLGLLGFAAVMMAICIAVSRKVLESK